MAQTEQVALMYSCIWVEVYTWTYHIVHEDNSCFIHYHLLCLRQGLLLGARPLTRPTSLWISRLLPLLLPISLEEHWEYRCMLPLSVSCGSWRLTFRALPVHQVLYWLGHLPRPTEKFWLGWSGAIHPLKCGQHLFMVYAVDWVNRREPAEHWQACVHFLCSWLCMWLAASSSCQTLLLWWSGTENWVRMNSFSPKLLLSVFFCFCFCF